MLLLWKGCTLKAYLFCSILLLMLIEPRVVIGFLSNEYHQYQQYLSISTFNTTEFFPAATKCEKGNRDRFFLFCAPRVVNQVMSFQDKPNLVPHWTRSFPLPSCSYNITQASVKPHQHTSHRSSNNTSHTASQGLLTPIYLKIHQHSCKDNFKQLLGGSSFYVLAEGYFQLTCSVVDYFNNHYDVFCPHVPSYLIHDEAALRTIDALDGCLRVTMILDFEHFDAYSESGTMVHPLYQELNYMLL